jgi:flagellar basal body rod protein FlgG
MRKQLLVVLSLVVASSFAMAQSKVDTKWHCEKPTVDHTLDVGDISDHTYMIAQGACKATASEDDLAEKSAQYTEFEERWKASYTGRGRFNVTADNGDKLYYTYEGTASTDLAKPAANKWKIVSGTGKYRGIKGSGTCSGKRTADSTDWECTGTYSIPK